MARPRCHQAWLWVLVGLALPCVGWSNASVPAGYRAIATAQGIPHTLLYAIALTESGKLIKTAGDYRPWPWTLNLAGRGYFFDSRLEAWQALTAWIGEGRRSIDIGMMQVSWKYHKDKLGNTWQALDPYHNLRVGAAILRACYQTRQDWWSSVGCYHAPANESRADRYRQRVVLHWHRINSEG
ncbi:transglycosylase SLT domain-containing protein [Sedimenticola selenatireducens]|uniref:transglycosylase SLT domain-containing protein n=1 Tax=Sedimenticola selenatireducens TaxID=191960 RepID=UPI0009FE0426|nr:transglycosylase SLT domain-containing protein [Sedimenticola selenatireducens]